WRSETATSGPWRKLESSIVDEAAAGCGRSQCESGRGGEGATRAPSPLSFQLRVDDLGAVRAVRAEGPAAVQGLVELVDALHVVVVVPERLRILREHRAVVEPARSVRVVRVEAERIPVGRARRRPDERVAEDLGLAAGVRDGGPLRRLRVVAVDRERLDLD